MIYWLYFTIVIILCQALAVLFYLFSLNRLLKFTERYYPEISRQMGNPHSVFDISQQKNYECYAAYSEFMAAKRYLQIEDSSLQQRFFRLMAIKQQGGKFAILVLGNGVLLVAALGLSACQ